MRTLFGGGKRAGERLKRHYGQGVPAILTAWTVAFFLLIPTSAQDISEIAHPDPVTLSINVLRPTGIDVAALSRSLPAGPDHDVQLLQKLVDQNTPEVAPAATIQLPVGATLSATLNNRDGRPPFRLDLYIKSLSADSVEFSAKLCPVESVAGRPVISLDCSLLASRMQAFYSDGSVREPWVAFLLAHTPESNRRALSPLVAGPILNSIVVSQPNPAVVDIPRAPESVREPGWVTAAEKCVPRRLAIAGKRSGIPVPASVVAPIGSLMVAEDWGQDPGDAVFTVPDSGGGHTVVTIRRFQMPPCRGVCWPVPIVDGIEQIAPDGRLLASATYGEDQLLPREWSHFSAVDATLKDRVTVGYSPAGARYVKYVDLLKADGSGVRYEANPQGVVSAIWGIDRRGHQNRILTASGPKA